MLTINTQFEHELKKRIDQERTRLGEILSLGQAIPDYATYMRYVGEFQALNRVTDIYCQEVNETLNKR